MKISAIADMVKEAERHADDMAKDRMRATEYYRGEMLDTPADDGRSQMVSRDVRAHIKKVLPSICRTILGGDEVVEYMPSSAEDEAGAQQATDYVNMIVLPESEVRDAIYDAVHDALLLRNGIIRWWWDDKTEVEFSDHSGLTDDQLAVVAADDSVEVLSHEETEENIDGMPVTLHSVQIKRYVQSGQIKVAAVPRERFLIHPDAVTLDDSLLTGEKCEMRRGDLIAMGYDRELIDTLPLADEDNIEEFTRRDFDDEASEADRANDPIDYYDLYIRIDKDGDGIAELRHMCFAGGLTQRNLLMDEPCSEVQYADVAVMRQPHQWEGISLFDDLADLQRAKTVLMRQTLDNIYWQNNPQPLMQDGAVLNPEAVFNPEFGLPIKFRQGTDVRAAMGFNQVPFVAKDSFGMMEYLDQEAQDRTGVTDASAGLAPDALQNMTAKASAMLEQGGIAQSDMMTRTVADDLRRVFRGILRLAVRHQDVPRTVRLRNQWVQVDPRDWNAKMDCAVNVGLGAGTRERDMMMMQTVIGLQEKLLSAFGPDNPYVTSQNLFNALAKMVESAGLKSVGQYFTQPDEEEVKRRLEAAKNQPNPDVMKEQAKAQAQISIEQAKIQANKELEQAKMVAQRDKEKAQMEADLIVKNREIEANTQAQAEQLAADQARAAQQLEWEREKFDREMTLKWAEMRMQGEAAREQRSNADG